MAIELVVVDREAFYDTSCRRPTTRVQSSTLEKEMKLKTKGSRADDGVDLSWSHFLKIELNPMVQYCDTSNSSFTSASKVEQARPCAVEGKSLARYRATARGGKHGAMLHILR